MGKINEKLRAGCKLKETGDFELILVGEDRVISLRRLFCKNKENLKQ